MSFAYDPIKLKVQISAPLHDVVVGSGSANRLLGRSTFTIPAGTSSLGLHAVNMMQTQFIVTAQLSKHMAQIWSIMGWDHTITNFKRPSIRLATEG